MMCLSRSGIRRTDVHQSSGFIYSRSEMAKCCLLLLLPRLYFEKTSFYKLCGSFNFIYQIITFAGSPLSVYRSTSTVGFPRESKISLAWILMMDMVQDLEIRNNSTGYFPTDTFFSSKHPKTEENRPISTSTQLQHLCYPLLMLQLTNPLTYLKA